MKSTTAAAKAIDTSKRHAGKANWSSEWSFIEEMEVVLLNSDISVIAGKQAVAIQDEAKPRVQST